MATHPRQPEIYPARAPVKKPVILLTTGTRGDVQPYLALGLGLQAAGLPVLLASDPQFAGLTGDYGLPFRSVEGNPSQILARPGEEDALSFRDHPLAGLFESLAFLKAARPVYRRMLASAWDACQGAGALVVGLPSLWGAHIAEALGVPCIYAFLQPFGRTASFPAALWPFKLAVPGLFNRWTYTFVEQAAWQPWRDIILAWRKTQLGLPGVPWWGIYDRLYADNGLVLNGFSPQVVPPPPDWPASHHTTGAWYLDPPPTWQPPRQLVAWLETGNHKPVYIGFGSANLRRYPHVASVIRQAIQETGLRAVASLPGISTGPLDIEQDIAWVQAIPHAWLFPCCVAAVHHGGAGTSAAALRAGIPSLACPAGSDEFFWASRLHALGIGPPPIPPGALTAPRLAESLRWMTSDPAIQARAANLGASIRAENGVERAVQAILSFLSGPAQSRTF